MATSKEPLAYLRLLPPELIGRIGGLEFLARGMMEGFITGRHRSPHKGVSVEFAEHKSYTPGDEVRDLDWRVFGKTDRYYIKRYVEETNLRANILLDASGSMKYTGDSASKVYDAPVSKFDYARYLAAALTYMMIAQQDAVGLVTFDTAVRRLIPASSTATQVNQILSELHETSPGSETSLAPIIHEIAERVHPRGLVVIISDLFDDPDEIIRAMHHFRYRRHEIIVFHVMADEELNFPFEKWSRFRDLERVDPDYLVDPKSLQVEYLRQVRAFVKQIEKGCGQMRADYVAVNTREPFDVVLSNYFARRHNRA